MYELPGKEKIDLITCTHDIVNYLENLDEWVLLFKNVEKLQEEVVKGNYNLGIAYDGDGDRCMLVDENGKLIGGDIILAIISNYLKSKN